MTDLTTQFVETIQPIVESGQRSDMVSLLMLSGPPEGVDPEDRRLIEIIKKAIAKFPDQEVHSDWHEIICEFASS